jgi:antitoxin (DNA-binding transcriptional repressor) of toxin-antitoxin stability system
MSINELKQQPDEQWLKSADNEDLIITSQGQPVAVLLPINAENLEPTLSTLRSVRAMMALGALQKAAEANGTGDLSVEEIDAEIKAARQAPQRSATLESFYDESKTW